MQYRTRGRSRRPGYNFQYYWLVALATSSLVGCGEPEVGLRSHMAINKMVSYVDSREPVEPLVVTEGPLDRKTQLGKLLFHDRRLSHDNSLACASCHDVSQGGDDGRRFSVGIDGAVGNINSPTVLNAAFNLAQFWDGRASDLWAQVAGPIHAPNEMGSNWAEVVSKLKADDKLRQEFNSLFATGITPETITECIVSYERQLITPDAPFDRYLRGDSSAVGADALEGYRLFKEVGCAACHQGKNVGGNLFAQFGVMREFFEDSPAFQRSGKPELTVPAASIDERHIKVPTLRNIELTGPYLHDGSAETLAEAIEVMSIYQLGSELSNRDVELIVTFLRSLTGVLREELK